MTRRREFQERFTNTSTIASRYRRQGSNDAGETGRSMKRPESIESPRAGLLRDFESNEYYDGTTYNSANGRVYDRDNNSYPSSDYHDLNTDELSINTSRNIGAPPRRIFDDV